MPFVQAGRPSCSRLRLQARQPDKQNSRACPSVPPFVHLRHTLWCLSLATRRHHTPPRPPILPMDPMAEDESQWDRSPALQCLPSSISAGQQHSAFLHAQGCQSHPGGQAEPLASERRTRMRCQTAAVQRQPAHVPVPFRIPVLFCLLGMNRTGRTHTSPGQQSGRQAPGGENNDFCSRSCLANILKIKRHFSLWSSIRAPIAEEKSCVPLAHSSISQIAIIPTIRYSTPQTRRKAKNAGSRENENAERKMHE